MKSILIDKLGILLLKEGFTVKKLARSCFDVLARKGDVILLIKALEDANSISSEYAGEMLTVSSYLGAVPCIIAEKAGDKLQDNVLYARFELYTFNFNTFANSLNQKFPFVKRTQAGFTVSIDGNKLKKKREERGYSLNSLSKKVGVTSKMIYQYEKGNSEITIGKAMKIHNLFGNHVFNEMSIFSEKRKISSKCSSELSKKYNELGFEASDTNKSPFDIIAKKDNEIILTEVGDKTKPDFSSLSKLLDADNLVIFKKKKPKNIPAVTKKEFLEFEKANQLIKFLKEF
ncbi:helix-turn-helix domain-containing protein [Candidatus Woesearchaeota archaeon]|nr:helix-turn-helix domain-containing protein [Candidatus Woesearchaeota archaeon]